MITAKSVTIFVGIGIAIAGAFALASVSREQGVVHKLLEISLGVFSLFAGLFISFDPTAGAPTLANVVTVLLFVRGLMGLVDGFQATVGKSWIFSAAVIDIVLAFLLDRVGPAGAAVTVGLYVGLKHHSSGASG